MSGYINQFAAKKSAFNIDHGKKKSYNCFLPVHLTEGKVETNLEKTDGTHNEQYYKWEFLECFVESGFCKKDYIGTEVQLPKGNKTSNPMKVDAAIFDDDTWFVHYKKLWTLKDDSKWDELVWLQDHLICCVEFKKEKSTDIKGVFNSQLK